MGKLHINFAWLSQNMFTENYSHFLFPYFYSDYPCGMIPILNVVLFKTADSSLAIRETAAQLLQLLERY